MANQKKKPSKKEIKIYPEELEDNKSNNPINQAAADAPEKEKQDTNTADESKRNNNKLEKSLIKIYDEQGKQEINMSKFDKKDRKNKILIYFIIFALLLILGWLAYFTFNPVLKFESERIGLSIEGPTSVLSGEDITYILKYSNQERADIVNSNLTVYLPEGFILKETNPANSKSEGNGTKSRVNSWDLSTLKVGETGTIEIKGKMISNADQKIETVTANLAYRPSNFNSEFQKTTSLDTRVTLAVVGINIIGPIQLSPEEKITYKITYTNNLPDSSKNVKITAFYPLGFTPDKITPEPSAEKLSNDESGNIWYKDDLKYAAEQIIEITGGFGKDNSGKKDLKVQIELKEGDALYPQMEKTLTTELAKEGLMLNLIINGGTENKSLSLGDYLNYSIAYRNNGATTLGDLAISINLDSEILDWSTLEDKNNGAKTDNSIAWNKSNIPALESLSPGNGGSIDFRIKSKGLSDVSNLAKDKWRVISLATMKVSKVNGQDSATTLNSNTINTSVSTDLNLTVEGRYFNDDNIAIGSGPLPPKVGATTSYKIFWTISNSIHEIKNIKVSATLPANVSWAAKYDLTAGQIQFKPETRQIIWEINRLPLSTKEATSEFEVNITPTTDQAGKILVLIPTVSLQAIDAVMGNIITQSQEGITTNLETDPIVKGKGVVVK
jgi:hypothetical protein